MTFGDWVNWKSMSIPHPRGKLLHRNLCNQVSKSIVLATQYNIISNTCLVNTLSHMFFGAMIIWVTSLLFQWRSQPRFKEKRCPGDSTRKIIAQKQADDTCNILCIIVTIVSGQKNQKVFSKKHLFIVVRRNQTLRLLRETYC